MRWRSIDLRAHNTVGRLRWLLPRLLLSVMTAPGSTSASAPSTAPRSTTRPLVAARTIPRAVGTGRCAACGTGCSKLLANLAFLLVVREVQVLGRWLVVVLPRGVRAALLADLRLKHILRHVRVQRGVEHRLTRLQGAFGQLLGGVEAHRVVGRCHGA